MDIHVNDKLVKLETGGREFDPSKPNLVFVHGAGMDHTVWALQSRYFAHHGFSVIAANLPGHGGSQGPCLSSVEEMADWLITLIGSLSCGRVGLVGHSMGALVTLETAAKRPDLVSFLSLVGVSVPMPVNADLLAKTKNSIPEAVELIVNWAFGRRAQIGGTRTPGFWMLGGGRQLLMKSKNGQLHADFKACNEYLNGLSAAKNIKCPTLIVAGADDKMTPPGSIKTIAENITGSDTAVIPSAGHMMMIETPDELLQTLWDFASSNSTVC